MDCKPCSVQYEKKEDLVEHIKTNHFQPGMDLTASQRVLLFPSPGFVVALEKDTDDESSVTKTTEEVKIKEDIIKDDLPFECEFCDRRFTSRYRLKTHTKIHAKDEYIKEKDRDRSFTEEERTTGEVQCVICDKRFKNLAGCRIHTAKVHAPLPSMECEICEYKCTTRKGIRKHMLEIHTPKRPISDISGFRSCDSCGYRSKSKRAFDVHMDEKHPNTTQGSPPLKKQVHSNLNETQSIEEEKSDEESDMDEDDESMEAIRTRFRNHHPELYRGQPLYQDTASLKENIKSLEAMIEHKNTQLILLEKESTELKAEKNKETKRRHDIESEIEHLN